MILADELRKNARGVVRWTWRQQPRSSLSTLGFVKCFGPGVVMNVGP